MFPTAAAARPWRGVGRGGRESQRFATGSKPSTSLNVPPVAKEVQDLIRKLSSANIGWGVPRIIGELRKLGIHVAKSTVEKYRVKHPKSPSPTWKSFLANHLTDLVAIDFFVVPTLNFKVLYVLVVLAHHRRKVVYFNVTEHPTAQWVGQQMVEAFPWDSAPRYLLRDRDAIYGERFRRRVHSLLINEVITAPRSPWHNPYVERISKEGCSLSVADLIAHCKQRIAGYKCPRSVDIRQAPLPLSGAGKILKAELRASFWAGKTRQVS